jgi:hypothetical protein
MAYRVDVTPPRVPLVAMPAEPGFRRRAGKQAEYICRLYGGAKVTDRVPATAVLAGYRSMLLMRGVDG